MVAWVFSLLTTGSCFMLWSYGVTGSSCPTLCNTGRDTSPVSLTVEIERLFFVLSGVEYLFRFVVFSAVVLFLSHMLCVHVNVSHYTI